VSSTIVNALSTNLNENGAEGQHATHDDVERRVHEPVGTWQQNQRPSENVEKGQISDSLKANLHHGFLRAQL
jgi:hypothetical protein